jgi:apolipoprotein D and lipocalin family protein
VPAIDLKAFMGDWNVLGNIPSGPEKGCHNALEQYALQEDGTVAITFSCNKGSFTAPREINHFTGLIQNPGINTEWKVRMKFLGFIPIKLPYLVIDLAADGSYTVIGYPSRDYVWIMARGKTLPEEVWTGILSRLTEQGYDTTRVERVPLQ